MAVLTRIELAISSVTERCVNHYTTEPIKFGTQSRTRTDTRWILSPLRLPIARFGQVFNLAEAAGLEPTTIGSEGRCSNQLNYTSPYLKVKNFTSFCKVWYDLSRYLLIKVHFGDPYGNQTRRACVKGMCVNRFTNGPY